MTFALKVNNYAYIDSSMLLSKNNAVRRDDGISGTPLEGYTGDIDASYTTIKLN